MVYDAASRSMVQIGKPQPSISIYTKPQMNDDGSLNLYFGPGKAPAGKENNWIQTNPKPDWSPIFRFYSPLQPFFDQTWKPNDLELIE